MNEVNPSYGAGNNPICARCIERMRHEHDAEHQLCERLMTMVIPMELDRDGHDAWGEIKDLLKIIASQKGARE